MPNRLLITMLPCIAVLCSACHPPPKQTTYRLNECGKQYEWQAIQGEKYSIYARQLEGDPALVIAFGTHVNQDDQSYVGVQFNLRTAPGLPYEQPEQLKGRYLLSPVLPGNNHTQNQGVGILWQSGQPGRTAKDGELIIDEIKIIEEENRFTFQSMTGRFHFRVEKADKSTCTVSGEFHDASFNFN